MTLEKYFSKNKSKNVSVTKTAKVNVIKRKGSSSSVISKPKLKLKTPKVNNSKKKKKPQAPPRKSSPRKAGAIQEKAIPFCEKYEKNQGSNDSDNDESVESYSNDETLTLSSLLFENKQRKSKSNLPSSSKGNNRVMKKGNSAKKKQHVGKSKVEGEGIQSFFNSSAHRHSRTTIAKRQVVAKKQKTQKKKTSNIPSSINKETKTTSRKNHNIPNRRIGQKVAGDGFKEEEEKDHDTTCQEYDANSIERILESFTSESNIPAISSSDDEDNEDSNNQQVLESKSTGNTTTKTLSDDSLSNNNEDKDECEEESQQNLPNDTVDTTEVKAKTSSNTNTITNTKTNLKKLFKSRRIFNSSQNITHALLQRSSVFNQQHRRYRCLYRSISHRASAAVVEEKEDESLFDHLMRNSSKNGGSSLKINSEILYTPPHLLSSPDATTKTKQISHINSLIQDFYFNHLKICPTIQLQNSRRYHQNPSSRNNNHQIIQESQLFPHLHQQQDQLSRNNNAFAAASIASTATTTPTTITSLEFDSNGILLACSNSRGIIQIFDFDEISSCDMYVRNIFQHTLKNQISRVMQEYQLQQQAEEQVATQGNNQEEKESSSDTSNNNDETSTTDQNNQNPKLEQENSYSPDENQIHSQLLRNFTPHTIPPIIQLDTKSGRNRRLNIISCLKWNPNNQDEIAVSFSTQHEVYMYNLNYLGGRNQKDELSITRITNSQVSRQQDRNEGNSSLLFLDNNGNKENENDYNKGNNKKKKAHQTSSLLVGSNSGVLRMWSISKRRKRNNKQQQPSSQSSNNSRHNVDLIWSIQIFESGESISDIVNITHQRRKKLHHCPPTNKNREGFLLVGGNAGSITLLDYLNCSRKVFSSSATPTILKRFNLGQLLRGSTVRSTIGTCLPPQSILGIKKIMMMNNTTTLMREDSYNASSSTSQQLHSSYGGGASASSNHNKNKRKFNLMRGGTTSSSSSTSSKSTTMSTTSNRMNEANAILKSSNISIITSGGWAFTLKIALLASSKNKMSSSSASSMYASISTLHTTKRVDNTILKNAFDTTTLETNIWSSSDFSTSGCSLVLPGLASSSSPTSSINLCVPDIPSKHMIQCRDQQVILSDIHQGSNNSGNNNTDSDGESIINRGESSSSSGPSILIVDSQNGFAGHGQNGYHDTKNLLMHVKKRIDISTTASANVTPTIIVAHPNKEWIVVGCCNNEDNHDEIKIISTRGL